MTKKSLLFLFFVLFSLGQSTAQTSNTEQDKENISENANDELNNKKRWEAHLPGGHYAIPLGHIVSISKHQYLLDGTVSVTEVTIDSNGNSLARFYYMEPITADSSLSSAQKLTQRGQELLNQAGRTTGNSAHLMAQKNYPQSTHAHTIEFRLLSLAELDALYNSLYSSWDSGKGRNFSIQ